ncbi:MAG TPA: endo-1,4-beta-xylanase [Candidatus Limivivens intestinipullorum]|uniref:endo-1,4-beta-xylanase n=1 Tax=Candidatus Limivivens intestinipullorum TaxID=2840858 RepID=A0A9D1JJC3_9FIRM|nr:endo-1,4-beta-xylanase [Candidatus Limivivens intestinipullorum]
MNQYHLKRQENALDTYVLYNTERIPQKYCGRKTDTEIIFETKLNRAFFLTKLMVPGFGGAYLFADNLGKGYAPDGELLDFCLEAARSRKFHLEAFLKQVQDECKMIPKNSLDRMETAGRFILEGKALESLRELLWAGEELVEFWSRCRIAKRGRRKNFLLGCSTKGFTGSSEKWKELFGSLFNAVCIPTHWGVLEPERGETHYEVLNEMVSWCRTKQMNIRGHAVVWFCSLWEKQNWMGRLSYEEVRRLCLARVEMLMERYGSDFDCIDFNEPMQSNGLNMTFDEHFAIVREAYDVVKRHNPKCRIMINFFNEWQEFYGLDREETLKEHYAVTGLKASEYEWSVTVYDYIDRCLREGMVIDYLGLQWHDHPYDLFGSYQLIRQWYDRYGIPVQITELEVASGTGRPLFTIGRRPNPAPQLYWHEPWSEAVQAEWFEKYLLLAYSMEEVEAFCVFGFCEAPTQWGNYVEGKGIAEWFKVSACAYSCLLDENFRPKASYYILKRMARELGILREKGSDSRETH